MAPRPHRAPRATRSPFRVGLLARHRLERLALQDSAAIAAQSRSDNDRAIAETTTPTVQAIQAHANAYARREEQRFFSNVQNELTEYRVLTKSLEADLAVYEEKTAGLSLADREAIARGSGPAIEELRRVERRIKRGHRRADELSALIHSRFTAAKLRAGRYYDFSDERIAIYWGALRRASAGTVADGMRSIPALGRPDWLTTKENTKLIELWQGRTDVQA
ncbi:hypothetical protein ACFVWR_12855 [Leifsonia sp. NPDC058292]|uniref:hypothetical protein n=1 Tax=Leifsonia sp. NPDC058292 TaxID=3346428 RepID=UPI0036DB85EE